MAPCWSAHGYTRVACHIFQVFVRPRPILFTFSRYVVYDISDDVIRLPLKTVVF